MHNAFIYMYCTFLVYTSHVILLFVLSYYRIDDHTTDDLVFYIRGFSANTEILPYRWDCFEIVSLARHTKISYSVGRKHGKHWYIIP